MRSSKIACALCCLFLLAPLASASELVGGQDENPADGEAPFTILERDSPSIDGEQWTLTLEMNQAEYDNGTEFQISTQICTNDGVCDSTDGSDGRHRRADPNNQPHPSV